jgi:hypothetical protein
MDGRERSFFASFRMKVRIREKANTEIPAQRRAGMTAERERVGVTARLRGGGKFSWHVRRRVVCLPLHFR